MKHSHDRLRPRDIARSLAIGLGATATTLVLWAGPSTPASANGTIDSLCTPQRVSTFDQDCDGILNGNDRYPAFPEFSNDVDMDGLPNIIDSQPYSPYVTPVVTTPGAPLPDYSTAPSPAPSTYYPGTWRRILDTDRDGDMINNIIDPHPDNRDYDNDGLIDGLDPDPTVSSKWTERREQDKRTEAKSLAELLEERRLEAVRLQQAREQASWLEKQLETKRVTESAQLDDQLARQLETQRHTQTQQQTDTEATRQAQQRQQAADDARRQEAKRLEQKHVQDKLIKDQLEKQRQDKADVVGK